LGGLKYALPRKFEMDIFIRYADGEKVFIFHIPEKHKKAFLDNWYIIAALCGIDNG
jgi:hypothetical protein